MSMNIDDTEDWRPIDGEDFELIAPRVMGDISPQFIEALQELDFPPEIQEWAKSHEQRVSRMHLIDELTLTNIIRVGGGIGGDESQIQIPVGLTVEEVSDLGVQVQDFIETTYPSRDRVTHGRKQEAR